MNFLNAQKLCVFVHPDRPVRFQHVGQVAHVHRRHAPRRTAVQRGRVPARSVRGHGVSSAVGTAAESVWNCSALLRSRPEDFVLRDSERDSVSRAISTVGGRFRQSSRGTVRTISIVVEVLGNQWSWNRRRDCSRQRRGRLREKPVVNSENANVLTSGNSSSFRESSRESGTVTGWKALNVSLTSSYSSSRRPCLPSHFGLPRTSRQSRSW